MKKNYLLEDEIQTRLNLGRVVEMFLGRDLNGEGIIHWLALQTDRDNRIVLSYHQVYDEGNVNFIDIYAFSPVDPDDFYQEYPFESLKEVREFIRHRFQRQDLHFLNQGMIQEEYRALWNNS